MALGEQEFTGRSGTVYHFNFGTNAICRVEEETGQSYREVIDQMKSPQATAKLARLYIWAALIDRTDLTMERAGDILDDLGGAFSLLRGFQQAATEEATPIAADLVNA